MENPASTPFLRSDKSVEEDHHALFQRLWVNFSLEEYQHRIERYVHRLSVNRLGGVWLNGFQCIDFGCGHGNFAHALIQEGAERVHGFDFGEASIAYAIRARDQLKYNGPQKLDQPLSKLWGL